MEKINRLQQIELNREIFRTEGFESPSRIMAKSGDVVLATDKGLRSTNEDVLLLDIEHDSFAVIDGMGGYEKGEVAAQILAEAIGDDFKKPEADPSGLQHQASLCMRERDIYQGGAAYLAGRIKRNGKELLIYQAGNCRLIIVNKHGSIKFTSEPNGLAAAPRGKSPGQPKINKGIRLENYDCIIAATDGLWDNVLAEKVAQIVASEKVESALKQLAELAKKGMKGDRGDGGFGNPDNITVLIYQILPVPLRGK